MKHYDESEYGNDCFIAKHWYFLPAPKCVVRVIKASGYFGRGIETTTFEEVCDEMPNEVKEWLI